MTIQAAQARTGAMAAPIAAFKAFIGAPGFPCVGAKAALAQRRIRFIVAGDIRDPGNDRLLARRWQRFAARVRDDSLFVALVALFPLSPALTEVAFESALWSRLRAVHAIDRRHFRWDARVSPDPASPHFSMSVGGKAFYVIGLHPAASRPARRFDCPALVFNLHSQFERLRADGRYDKLRRVIGARDIALCGSTNPMLAVHGESSEARQYSGRQVDATWVCPFHARIPAPEGGSA